MEFEVSAIEPNRPPTARRDPRPGYRATWDLLSATIVPVAERDHATGCSVSRITVRKAIDGLVSEGLLVRRQRSGIFVRAHLSAVTETLC